MKSLLCSVLLLGLVAAHVNAQEVQVPFDSAGKIMVINQDMEKQLHFFDSYPHFLEARLYREPDSSYILEVTSFEHSQLVKDRVQENRLAVAAMRDDISARLSGNETVLKLDQNSRTKFLVWETLLSFFAYGPFMISAISPDNGSLGTGLELVIGGLGYLIPSALTEHASMTDGESSLALGGAFLGVAHGLLLDELLSNGNPGQELGILATATSIAETGIGYAVASKNNMTEGTSDIIRYGGLFGMLDGMGLAGALNNEASASFVTGFGLAGSAAGFLAGTAMANSQNYTRGNASVVLTAGLYGALLPPMIIASAIAYDLNNNPTSGLLISSVAGNIASIMLANSLMQGRHLTSGEGTMVILGTTAGFAIGLGTGYILSSGSDLNTSPWAFTIPMVIGTAAGFAISVAAIGKGTANPTTGWNFQANPGVLMGALLPQRTSNPAFNAPFFSASYRF